jgi:hypothetical protein
MEQPANPYFAHLTESRGTVLPQIEALMAKCHSVPVGWGFIDVITRHEQCDEVIARLTELGVAINIVTLWCDCTEENKSRYGCPHGYGGPMHAAGYFSEMCERDYFDVKDFGVDLSAEIVDRASIITTCNKLAAEYVATGIKQRVDYSPCLVPGFWLAVPKDWKRQTYLVAADA